MAESRRTRAFALTVLAGLAGAGAAVVASGRTWARGAGDAAGMPVQATVRGADAAPLVIALALVGLAGWGAFLATRGRWRRVVALLGLTASVGALAATAAAFGTARDDVVDAVTARGGTGAEITTALAGWYYLAALGAAASAVAFAVAVRCGGRWPVMGAKYDAPAAARGAAAPAATSAGPPAAGRSTAGRSAAGEPAAGESAAGRSAAGPSTSRRPDVGRHAEEDLWRALDEGRDPTA